MELAPAEGRHSILEKEQDTFEGDARASTLLAHVARIHGFDDLATTYFKSGQKALECGDDEFASRLSIAHEAMVRGEPRTAADMLTDHLELNRDSAELRLLAHALVYDFPIRARAERFFEDLSPEVRSLPFFQKVEGVFHINRGAAQDAVCPLASVFGAIAESCVRRWKEGGVSW